MGIVQYSSTTEGKLRAFALSRYVGYVIASVAHMFRATHALVGSYSFTLPQFKVKDVLPYIRFGHVIFGYVLSTELPPLRTRVDPRDEKQKSRSFHFGEHHQRGWVRVIVRVETQRNQLRRSPQFGYVYLPSLVKLKGGILVVVALFSPPPF